MPGLTFVSSPYSDPATLLHRFDEAQKSMLHGAHYRAHRDIVQSTCVAGHVGYAEYPVQTFRVGTAEIYLEGCIYNVDAQRLRVHLAELADRVFSPEGRNVYVRTWMEEHDGEYIILIANPEKQAVAVITDPLGRVPLYYYKDDSSVVLARECKFITHFTGNQSFDKIGCAQFLWSGYPLGRRTLFEAAKLVPPAMLLIATVRGEKLETTMEDVLNFNAEDKDTTPKTPDEYASELLNLMLATTYDRGHYPAFSTSVVSLSGGWDSRVIAAALARTHSKTVSVTHVTAQGRGVKDANHALRIASALGLECELLRVRPLRQGEEDRLVYMKDGLNFVTMAYNIALMEQLVLRFGARAVYMTGDGGAHVMSLKGLRRSVSNMDELMHELIAERSILRMDTAEGIMGLPHGTLENELYNVVSTFPENDMNQRGVHFALYERGRRWGYEGEDRTRFYMWQTTPFYAYPFFRYGLRIPDSLKRDNKLYRRFQIKLSRESARLPDSNTGIPPASPLYPYAARIKRYLITSHTIRQHLKPLLLRGEFGRRKDIPEEALSYLRHAADSNHKLMNTAAANEMLSVASKFQYDNWWTLALLDKHVTRGAYGPREYAHKAKLA